MKTKSFAILAVLIFSSCSSSMEFVRSGFVTNQQFNNVNMPLFLSECHVPDYKEIGIARIKTMENNLDKAANEARKTAFGVGGNCIIYKQVVTTGGSNSSYTFEFIVGELQ